MQSVIEQAQSLLQMGDRFTGLEQFDQAAHVFRQFIAIDFQAEVGWTNLGNVLRVQDKLDEALSAYQTAIRCNPRYAPAFSNLGNLLKDRGQIEQAIDAFRKAVELDPGSSAVHSNLVYATCFSPDFDSAQQLAVARGWSDAHEKPLLSTHQPHGNRKDANRKINIGYVSGDFRNHVVGRNVLPVLQNHDRSLFQVHCFSSLFRHDNLTHDFVQAADVWHDCASLDDVALADLIRSNQIDILVDLTLHMAGNRLKTFARKAAPIQVTWAGYPGTTGLKSIDYRITDSYIDPPGETDGYYSEKSIRLPHSFWCYRPIAPCPDVNGLPASTNPFVTFGCLNHFGKVTQSTLELWTRVLIAIPNARLVLLAPRGECRDRLFKDIDPDRVSFVDLTLPQDHMIRYHQIDIALDPLPYTGHTTTLDALWMGVPVITLSGETCMSRGSVTALSNLGLQNLIATTGGQYVSTAVHLAGDVSHLSTLRQKLRDRMRSSPLCDEVKFTRDLEACYRKMWTQYAME